MCQPTRLRGKAETCNFCRLLHLPPLQMKGGHGWVGDRLCGGLCHVFGPTSRQAQPSNASLVNRVVQLCFSLPLASLSCLHPSKAPRMSDKHGDMVCVDELALHASPAELRQLGCHFTPLFAGPCS